jgi:hypothetical protein
MGEGAPEPPGPPGIPGFATRRWSQGSVVQKCNWVRGLEIHLDWCHPAFAHRWTHVQSFIVRLRGFSSVRYETRLTERGMVVFMPPTAHEDAPLPDAPIVQMEYEMPNRVTVRTTAPFETSIVLHVVPTGAATCRLEWIFPVPLPFGPRVRWTDGEPRIFAEDRVLLESAEARAGGSGEAPERHVEADWSTLLFRRVVALVERGEWSEGRASLPARRVVEVRS